MTTPEITPTTPKLTCPKCGPVEQPLVGAGESPTICPKCRGKLGQTVISEPQVLKSRQFNPQKGLAREDIHTKVIFKSPEILVTLDQKPKRRHVMERILDEKFRKI
jgi:hypothetical protein